MNLTKRQKSGAAIAIVCVTALAVDKVILSPPAGAVASTAAAPVPAVATIPVTPHDDAPDISVDGPTPRAVLADRFETFAAARGLDASAVPDAFQTPSEWQQDDRPIVIDVPESAEGAEFRRRHRLTAVMANGGRGLAIIDGRGLRVGQKLDGFELVEVNKRSVVLVSAGLRVTLTLDEP
ncbi:MAG: hypothetical protein GY715_12485 [Planctomycetes bacterium]|nr:hypothetical protein [Planctomycetota bacterium]